jgi:hypothetical protein
MRRLSVAMVGGTTVVVPCKVEGGIESGNVVVTCELLDGDVAQVQRGGSTCLENDLHCCDVRGGEIG